MKNLIINCSQTLKGQVLFMLDDDIPNVFAQYVAAILSTINPLNSASAYDVETVIISRGLFPNEADASGGYLRERSEILIDVDRCVEGAVELQSVLWEFRYLAFRMMLVVAAHEALHSVVAKDVPEGKTEEDVVLNNEITLLHEAINLWAIDVDAETIDFFRQAVLTAIDKHGLYRFKKAVSDDYVCFDERTGISLKSWREVHQAYGFATAKEEDLFSLPAIVGGDIFETEEEPAVATAAAAPAAPPAPTTPVNVAMVGPAHVSMSSNMEFDSEGMQYDPQWLDDDDFEIPPPTMSMATSEPTVAFAKTEELPFVPTNAPAPPAPPAPAAPTGPTPPPQSGDTTDDLKQLFLDVMLRCHSNIFSKCGWDGHGGFSAPKNVCTEPVYVGDLVNKHMLAECHAEDANGRKMIDTNVGATITGFVAHKSKLPMYHLVFKINGQKLTRRLVPQNPNKTDDTGQLKKNAVKAREGNRICWIIDPDNNKLTYQITNEKPLKLN